MRSLRRISFSTKVQIATVVVAGTALAVVATCPACRGGESFFNQSCVQDWPQPVCANLGEAVTSQQVSAMISKVDENGDGNIDYEEFAKARRRAAPRRACAPRRLTARAPNAGARRRGVDALRRKEEGRRQVRGQ